MKIDVIYWKFVLTINLHIFLCKQQVQMVIDGDMEGVIASDGVVTDAVDPASVNLVVHEVPEVCV